MSCIMVMFPWAELLPSLSSPIAPFPPWLFTRLWKFPWLWSPNCTTQQKASGAGPTILFVHALQRSPCCQQAVSCHSWIYSRSACQWGKSLACPCVHRHNWNAWDHKVFRKVLSESRGASEEQVSGTSAPGQHSKTPTCNTTELPQWTSAETNF